MFLSFLPIIFQEWTDPFKKGSCKPTEKCSRFIFHKKHFYAKNGKAKPAAFAPKKGHGLSVYRIDNCSEPLIWYLCKKYIEPKRRKNALGRADFKAQILMDHGLKLSPDGKPHKRHLNVEGWPSEEKLITAELSQKAEFIHPN